jgi:L-ornithine N5-oxygenase
MIPNRAVISAKQLSDSGVLLKLGFPEEKQHGSTLEEELEVDYVFAATGYRRNAHAEMLEEIRELLPEQHAKEGNFLVARNYRIQYDEQKVDGKAGVWLQGCNEKTHGVSSSDIFRYHN